MAGLSLNSYPVNLIEACQSPVPEIVPRRTQNSGLGSFLSNAYALELTVPHKTVAEAH
jgi:hypothetical protein